MKNFYGSISAKVAVLILSVMMIVAFSFTGPMASFAYAGTNGGVESADEVDVMISLSADTPGQEALIPVSGMTKAELEAAITDGNVKLELVRDESKPYLDKEMFPYQKDGGELSTWTAQNGSELFTDLVLTAEEDGGELFLKVTFTSNCYFYSRNRKDYSAPHSGGGAYLDVCGYFNLKASVGETALGSASAKVTPYENFHTMDEVYQDIDAMAAYDTTRFVEKYSMGKSTAGRDMPYLIVAKDAQTVQDWLAYCELAETDPDSALAKIEAGNIDDIKVPVLYSNIHSNEVAATDGIIDFAWKLIKEDTIPYKYLEGFTEEGEAQFEEEMGPVGTQGSTAIPDLIKDTATYLGWLKAGNSASGKVDLEKYYDISEKGYKVDEILEDVFFIIVPEENVDGRAQDTREAANGFDLNRDNSFQVTPETANMQKLIGTYNPVSVTEFHGRVNAFQCEPCDPPHEPNFEYDLLAEHLIPGGEALGNAAVANNPSYNSYVIPQRDYLVYTGGENDETYWDDPWDDMSTSYTPQYAMLHGAVAYTVELPAYSDDATQLVSYGIIGNSAYVAQEKAGYMKAQAEIYKRGVENFNSDAFELVGQWLCDQYDVEGAEMDIFRPEYDGEGENGNFYPEAYIIPIDGSIQKNLQAARDMIKYLVRNDVKVYKATKEFTLDGVDYPKNTIIVPMYQAKRSVANGVLNNGTLITSWTVLYSEGITAFNKTRGFDMTTVTKPSDYDVLKTALGTPVKWSDVANLENDYFSTYIPLDGQETPTYVIIKNVSEDSTKAVNKLLSENKSIGIVTEGEFKGDFLTDDIWAVDGVMDDYALTVYGVDAKDIKAQNLKEAKVYIVGRPADATSGFIGTNRVTSGSYVYNYDRYAMDLMGFKVVSDPAEADIIVGGASISNDAAAADAVKAGKPYITYTSAVADSRGWYGNTPGNLTTVGITDFTRVGLSGAMDCLCYVEYPEETMVNATYVNEEDDIMYGYGVGYFSKIPEGAKALVKVQNKTPLEGFIPTMSANAKAAFETYLDGGILGFEYTENGYDVAAFSQSLTNKVHQRDEYQFISNFIFSRSTDGDYVTDVKQAIEDLKNENAQTKAELEEAQKALEEAQKALEEAQKAQEETDKKVADLEKTAEAAKAEADANKEALDKAVAAQEEDAAKIAALEKAAEEAAAKEDTAQKDLDAAKEAQAKDAENIAALQKSVDEANAAITALQKEVAQGRKITDLKLSSKSKKVTVKWKKASGASSYQVQYKLSTAKKWKNLKKSTTKAKAVTKKLKKGKKYNFRVRPISKVNGKKVYGKWVKKTIKVK